MKKILIINGHQYYPFAEGKLNQALIDRAASMLGEEDFDIKNTVTEKAYDVDEEIEKVDLYVVRTQGTQGLFNKFIRKAL